VLIILMMEAASTSEMLVNFYQTTQCYNPEDSHLHYQNPFTITINEEEETLVDIVNI
jgi:hypothetical protein